MNTTLVRIADFTGAITSNTPAVTEWSARYFGPWWSATTSDTAPDTTVVIRADLDEQEYEEIGDVVRHAPDTHTVSYSRQPLTVARIGDVITAVNPVEHVAYRVTAGDITVVGLTEKRLRSAACQLLREAARGHLIRAGWLLLHASAAVDPDGLAWLAFGGKGAGKTSTGFQLCTARRWSLLANDRVFARPGQDGQVHLLPWPAAAAMGLGLVTAMGWWEPVAEARDELHTSTPPLVHYALAAGERAPVYGSDGKELKVQFYPDQIPSVLGIPLATSAVAAGLIFPAVGDTVSLHREGRPLGPSDSFGGSTEDRYPNVFALSEPETPQLRETVFQALHRLSRYTVSLSHDIDANAELLAGITDEQVTV